MAPAGGGFHLQFEHSSQVSLLKETAGISHLGQCLVAGGAAGAMSASASAAGLTTKPFKIASISPDATRLCTFIMAALMAVASIAAPPILVITSFWYPLGHLEFSAFT